MSDRLVNVTPSGRWIYLNVGWISFLMLVMALGSANEHNLRGGVILMSLWGVFLVPVLLSARTRVTADERSLTYQSMLRRRTWLKDEIQEFKIESPRGSPFARQVVMRTTEGRRVPLLPAYENWPFRSGRTQSALRQLELWRRA